MKRIGWAAIVLAGISLAGCGGYATYAVVAPPPVRVEAYGPMPGPGYVWVNGYWGYRGGGYAWVPGRWSRPPRGRRAWEDGRWEQRGGRYYYRRGHWR